MWLFAVLVSAVVSMAAHASTQIKAQIYDIDEGSAGEETLILLTTGHVARVKEHAKKTNLFHELKEQKSWVEFTLNDKLEIEHSQLIDVPVDGLKFFSTEPSDEIYKPTVLDNLEQAKTYFHEARYVNKESQCYNRAHVWAYEWFLKHTVYSNKTWLFFTRKYIRKYKFEWWFHVSPSVQVNDNGVVKEKIMDVKYGRGPIDPKRWTDIFMQNDATCPLVKTYSDYANYPETGWCFTMRTSMFYYQPFDVEMKETWGTIKGNWYDSEVKAAYLEAFDETI